MVDPRKRLFLKSELHFKTNARCDKQAKLIDELIDLLDTKLNDSGVFAIDEASNTEATIWTLEILPTNEVRAEFYVAAQFSNLRQLAHGCDSGPYDLSQKNPIDFELDALQVETLVEEIRQHE